MYSPTSITKSVKRVTSKLLPLYWYIDYNVHIATEIDLGAVVIKQNNAMQEIINGLDYWSTCLFGPQAEMTDKYIMPDDQVTFSQRRKMILGNIIKAAVEKSITIPEGIQPWFGLRDSYIILFLGNR